MLDNEIETTAIQKNTRQAKPSAENLHFYNLPFEEGTHILTLQTLNSHSSFRFPKRSYLSISTRNISFRNEILTLGIKLGKQEKEERIYIQVQETELKVSCSTDTDEEFISRCAYFALYQFTAASGRYNFEKFYWPGFFDAKTGKSKYLDIINDRAGLEISIKPRYSFFYKPGQTLTFPFQDKITPRPRLKKMEEEINTANDFAIGYCLADTHLVSIHSPHFPFLVPYTGVWKENKEGIKTFHRFILDREHASLHQYSSQQEKLNDLCFKMMDLALIYGLKESNSTKENEAIKRTNIKKMKDILMLWQKTMPLLERQHFTHTFFTWGMSNVCGRPREKEMHPCTFSNGIPKICFLLHDKGDCYELEFRFKVGNKLFIPNVLNPVFFISGKDDPRKFYLLSTHTDYHVTNFFGKFKFRISVLKSHYEGHFKNFVVHLATVYDMQYTKVKKHNQLQIKNCEA